MLAKRASDLLRLFRRAVEVPDEQIVTCLVSEVKLMLGTGPSIQYRVRSSEALVENRDEQVSLRRTNRLVNDALWTDRMSAGARISPPLPETYRRVETPRRRCVDFIDGGG